MSTFALVSRLPLVVEGYDLERLERAVSSAFTRVTTQIRLRGGGEEGAGEDVTYDAGDHDRLHAAARLPLAGEWTLESFSRRLDSLQLFPEPPAMPAFHDYRRWAFESAALDLALRQARRSLADALGREPRPVTFVVSMRLGERSTAAPVHRLLERYPATRFKLDP
ncbi:MAG: hypothetical protein M3310_05275, partial [Actinomycetota bacterium]|nr:hypothetical protein [Actinomycetota bacterium]